LLLELKNFTLIAQYWLLPGTKPSFILQLALLKSQ